TGGCDAGLVLCDGRCVDPTQDSSNCGACATSCSATQTCIDGACARAYHVRPDGIDSDDGSPAHPWRSIHRAVDKTKTPAVHPGETIVLMNGTWTTGINIDCSANGNANIGEENRPITIKAMNERQAFIRGDGKSTPFRMSNCAHWTIRGLR